MKAFYLLTLLILTQVSIKAETFIYFQNNTSLDLNITNSSTLSSSYWNETFSGNFEAWKLQTQIYEVNRNVGITSGTDFFLTTTVTSGTESIDLKIKLNGNFTGSDMWHSASGNSFSHAWHSTYNFYSEEFVLNSDTFILTYRSDFPPGNLWADVYYVLQEKHPYTLDTQELQDSNVLNILSYNIFMLTPPIGSSEEYDRAGIMHKYVQNYDAIIFSEAFYNDARNDLLIPLLSPEYPYHTAVVNGGLLEDGGVMIFSRWPIEYEQQYLFTDCDGSDCLSSKGVMYAKINKLGKTYHLFGTHTQAWPDPTSIAVRLGQLGELHTFIESQSIPNTEAVLIGGDLNVNKANSNQSLEYLPMLDSLNVEEPSYLGRPYTYDPTYSVYASGTDFEYLDYVFVEKDYLCAYEYTNTVKIFRHVEQIDDLWDNNSLDLDLSDHYPVHGRFVFPDIKIFAENDSLCTNENLLLYVESNVDLNFQWYRNDTLLVGEQNDSLNITAQNASYYCKATNSSCIDINSNELEVFVYSEIEAPIISRTNNTISSSNSNGIQWFFNGNLMTGENNSSITSCLVGDYYCTSSVGECTSEASNIISIETIIPVISLYENLAVSSIEEGNQWYNSQGAIAGATNDSLILCEDDDYFVIVNPDNCPSDSSNIISYQSIFNAPIISWIADSIFSSYSSGNLWYLDGNLLVNDTLNFIVPQTNGIYSNVLSTNCGLLFSNEIEVKNTGIESVLVEDIFIYPNPVYGNEINISLDNVNAIKLRLIDIMGKQVYQQSLENDSQKNISLPFGLNGLFYVIIENEKQQRFIQKIRIVN